MKNSMFVLLTLIVTITLSSCGGGLEFAIPKSQLDPKIKAKFPVTKGAILAVQLSNPELEYLDTQNKLQVDVDTVIRALGVIPAKGRVQVQGSLGYRKADRTIIMTDVSVKKMNIKGLPDGKHEEVLGLVGQAVRPVLNELELYQFDSDSRLETLAGASLKGFRVEKDQLVVRIGAGE